MRDEPAPRLAGYPGASLTVSQLAGFNVTVTIARRQPVSTSTERSSLPRALPVTLIRLTPCGDGAAGGRPVGKSPALSRSASEGDQADPQAKVTLLLGCLGS